MDYSKVDFRGDLSSVSGNYNNFTVENINQTFEKGDKSLKDIIEIFGKPDTIWVNYVDNQYNTDLYWKKMTQMILIIFMQNGLSQKMNMMFKV